MAHINFSKEDEALHEVIERMQGLLSVMAWSYQNLAYPKYSKLCTTLKEG